MEEDIKQKIDDAWSQNNKYPPKSKWWQFPLIYQHINQIVCGKPLDGINTGLNLCLKNMGITFEHGISVGFGDGTKEFQLMKEGIVKNFTLFELSEERIKIAREKYDLLGLKDNVEFINGDCFSYKFDKKVDFVHWNNSLHHMMDVDQAVKWSYNILINGGVFYMDDYVGVSRFQWSEDELRFGELIRNTLPDIYLKNSNYPDVLLDKNLSIPDAKMLEESDPSEAADSDQILASVKKYFPDAEIHLTGGIVYHLALSDILSNINEADVKDETILKLLLIIDELATKSGIKTQYATALAVKKDNLVNRIWKKF